MDTEKYEQLIVDAYVKLFLSMPENHRSFPLLLELPLIAFVAAAKISEVDKETLLKLLELLPRQFEDARDRTVRDIRLGVFD
jgi:hypothetical protein